jgi:hypothetical protein
MPETSQLTFNFKEVVTALLKAQDIHEGIWGLIVNFGLSANNVGTSDSDLRPSAVIPILTLGIQKFDRETNLSVDAAKVNPQPAPIAATKTKKAPH